MKLQELKNLIRTEVRKAINESKHSLRENIDLKRVNFSKVTAAFKEMKAWDFEDDDAQEDFISEIDKIAKQLGIKTDLTDEPDIILSFLETVQDYDISTAEMLRELKSFLQELVNDGM